MNKEDREKLFNKAKAILKNNQVGSGEQTHTIPAHEMYPFQWNWDTGFIAYGYSHYDINQAIRELRALFLGQWANGMLPHIVFHNLSQVDLKDYSPGPSFWNSKKISKQAPKNVDTSSLTHPPLHALAVWHIYKKIKSKEILKEFYPKLFKLHFYLHTSRDPEKTGLVTIYHPWESGFDNSPRWDKPLQAIKPKNLPKYKRADTHHTNPKYRPTDSDYDRYIYLCLKLKKKKYNDKKIYPAHSFKVKDKIFSSILYLANKRLYEMAKILGLKKDKEKIKEWMRRFEKSFFEILWDKDDKLFYDYDVILKQPIKVKCVSTLAPVITGILPKEDIKQLQNHLNKINFCGKKSCNIHLIPSTDIKELGFNPEKYWRGPIWLNINWFIWRGLKEYGLKSRATHLANHILELANKKGFYEYYSPLTGKGLGAKKFSWSAALVIDICKDFHKKGDGWF